MGLKEKICGFLELTRAYSLGVTFASLFIIFALSFFDCNFTFLNFALLSLALCCVHLGGNLFDDYIDVLLKYKKTGNLKDINFNSFTPKARLIINGTYSFKDVERILTVLFSIALSMGICFILLSGWTVALYMAAGIILTLFYPVSSRYYLAEIIIGLIFGPLMITGGYFALCGHFSSSALILSIGIFFSTLVLLHTHSLMDWEFDIQDNKKTLCMLSKSKINAIKVLKFIISMSYAVVVLGVFVFNINPYILYVFLTLPIASKLIKSMKSYINIEDIKFEPKWYLGMFENWKTIKENRIDFFMYRFYLARNFAFFYALFIAMGILSR